MVIHKKVICLCFVSAECECQLWTVVVAGCSMQELGGTFEFGTLFYWLGLLWLCTSRLLASAWEWRKFCACFIICAWRSALCRQKNISNLNKDSAISPGPVAAGISIFAVVSTDLYGQTWWLNATTWRLQRAFSVLSLCDDWESRQNPEYSALHKLNPIPPQNLFCYFFCSTPKDIRFSVKKNKGKSKF